MSEKVKPPENLPGAPKEPEEEFFEEEEQEFSKEEVKTKDPSDPIQHTKRDLLIILGIFFAVVVLFILNNIITKSERTGEKTERKDQEIITAQEDTPSFYQGWIELDSGTAGDALYPGREYITISIVQENLSYLFLSDWSLRNAEGETFPIGKASYTPLRGQTNTESSVIVDAGDILVVSSGASPIGVSFRENACAGYLEQFQNFIPPISRTCPDVTQRMPDGLDEGFFRNTCEDYIERLPQCEAMVDPVPQYLSPACRNFVETQITYNSCVRTYRDSPGFTGNTWRIYLDEDETVWASEDETITLLDSEGHVVDTLEY